MTMQKVKAALEAARFKVRGNGATSQHVIDECIAKIDEALALLRSDAQGERGGALARLKDRIDSHLNDWLCEMKPDYDDSITGFNEAWDIVRDIFKKEIASTAAAPSPSDWEAGARAAREQDVAACKAAVPDDQPWPDRNARNRIMHFLAALPIPRRP